MAQSCKNRMEAIISEAYIKFLREILGRGPKETKTYIIHDMVIIRLKEVLTQEEKTLVQIERGRPLVKEMRRILRESHSEKTEAIISGITGCRVLSSHSDISTKLGEQVEVFILDCDLEKELKMKTIV
ncbi:DUF2294 domain-containing protein [Aneurinibacillus aneurinilyticus]|uniref:DUF2294 domain-containing protein n=2 Tax=Aneurinibacillus aneurinilyticus TaxID=1391 RepID=A0A848CYQ1_ANEAE|nr:DUF2294 domain-containing protein [Aneurinibacillus aneurinilyticus]MCI1694417.1 DUF2294 domain-containing protein [Aneurinibacillus aneurinilyticus]MED0669079.1 DUF2294 domain-containing protein [Aneurinibacillus aneurinilyticus]MED0706544.1 DUF2294 domain-containing protein [Aneurinibacillus aneurinilyticus]MED0724391.1 DUF2294 domain-containing protein [Aneurinibacillus aneurinilyticus]MED0730554.1 DUF2294 domain-containing protein [Aneurinibacillus aneurinilyticus]